MRCTRRNEERPDFGALARRLQRVRVLVGGAQFAGRVGVLVHRFLLGKRFVNSTPFVVEEKRNPRVGREEVFGKVFVLFVDFRSDLGVQARSVSSGRGELGSGFTCRTLGLLLS